MKMFTCFQVVLSKDLTCVQGIYLFLYLSDYAITFGNTQIFVTSIDYITSTIFFYFCSKLKGTSVVYVLRRNK